MNSTLPLISVIIPLYNVEEYIEECLQSIVKQTYKGQIECIIVDDCGRDHSVEKVENFISRNRSRIDFILLHHQSNQGASVARNTGLDQARGEYLFFLDADDFIDEKTLETMYTVFVSREKVGIVSSLLYVYPPEARNKRPYLDRWIHKDNKEKIIRPDQVGSSILDQTICHAIGGKLIARKLFNDVRFVAGRSNEDTRLFCDLSNMLEKYDLCLVELPFQYYAYRYAPFSTCSDEKGVDMDYLKNLMDIREQTNNPCTRACAQKLAFECECKYLKLKNIHLLHTSEDFFLLRDFLKKSPAYFLKTKFDLNKLIKYLCKAPCALWCIFKIRFLKS